MLLALACKQALIKAHSLQPQARASSALRARKGYKSAIERAIEAESAEEARDFGGVVML